MNEHRVENPLFCSVYVHSYGDDNVRTRERDLASYAVNMGLRNRPIKLKGGLDRTLPDFSGYQGT